MKHNTQTLLGMSKNALKEHYESIKGDYMKRSGKDARLEAYLMQVNSYIQMREREEDREIEV